MSGTGAIRQFVSKAVRLGSRAAFGHPSLALGQTALAVHDKASAKGWLGWPTTQITMVRPFHVH
jgi:hypothetical protein